jgi:simple sugar transport system permease protein
MAVRLEPCASPCAAAVVSVSLLAIVAAFLVAGLLLRAYGMRFPHDYVVLLHSTLGDPHGRAEVVRKTIPLLLAGIGLVVAFRAQCWNIGAEGQMLAGAIAAAGMALFVPLPPPWMLPAMFAAGALSGALCGCLPALLRVQLGVNEVLTTLMLNYIVLYLVQWLIHGPWKGKSALGFAYTDTFPEAAWLPLLPGTRVHWPTLLLGLLLAVGVALLLSRMRLGYEIRVVGQNPEAARYTGMNFLKVLLLVMGLSGAAAGLAGVGEVAGIHHKLLGPTQISLGYGYTAIIVAWLARGRVLATLCTAPLMGWIFASGDVMKGTLHLPFQVVDVMNGLLLFCLIGGERLMYYRVRWERHKQPAVPAGANPPL